MSEPDAAKVASIVGKVDWSRQEISDGFRRERFRRKALVRLERGLLTMLTATSEDEVEKGYWCIEGTAYMAARTFPAAAPVARCVLEAWPYTTDLGRGWGMTVWEQIMLDSRFAQDHFESCPAEVVEVGMMLREHSDFLYDCLRSEDDLVRSGAAGVLFWVESDRDKYVRAVKKASLTVTNERVRSSLEHRLLREEDGQS